MAIIIPEKYTVPLYLLALVEKVQRNGVFFRNDYSHI